MVPTWYASGWPVSPITSWATLSIAFLIMASSRASLINGTMTSGSTARPERSAAAIAASKIARACIS